MDLYTIINDHADITINIKGSDLRAYSLALIAETKALEQEKAREMQTGDRLMTVAEVVAFAKTSTSTLARMEKRGVLVPRSWNGEKRYLLSDIMNYINKTK